MSGGGSYNQSKANNQSNFNQAIPQWQSDAITKMYNAAANTFGNTGSARERYFLSQRTHGIQKANHITSFLME